MKKRKILTIIICIIIAGTIIYFGHKQLLGDHGLVEGVSTMEIEYYKNEVYNIITKTIKEKYLECYNLSKEDASKKISDFYNVDIGIQNLKEKGYLEYFYYSNFDENTGEYTYQIENISDETLKRNDIFYLNVSNIKDINQFGNGEKIIDNNINMKNTILLEKKQDEENVFIINYYNLNEEKQLIGEINLNEPI